MMAKRCGGNRSLMAPKQTQLDLTIARIFENMVKLDETLGLKSLLVVAGDHGMTDAGNHGGSSEAEVSTVRIFTTENS